MKDVPEIAPEVRHLLEEVVANPRSAIRLAPRRALRNWFDSGEMIRATDVSKDRAMRHLVEAHREELAALLREASWISYWKAPVLAHRPVGEDGEPYDPTQREPDLLRRVQRGLTGCPEGSDHVDLFRQCLLGIKPQHGRALAQASLTLVPNDRTRCYFAISIPWDKPRTAIAFFNRLARRAWPASLKPDILLSLGARMCSLDLLAEARETYRASIALSPQSPYGWICAFNLSCFLGDETSARVEAASLRRLVKPKDPRLCEESELLRQWAKTRRKSDLERASSISRNVADQIPEVADLSRALGASLS